MPETSVFDFSTRTHIMGILNVTPDSFSDGGRYHQVETAVVRALEMIEEGVDIIDIGGESSRPGAESVAVMEELRRVIPVIEAIRKHSAITLSLDTRKSQVARAGLDAGIDWINDISAGAADAHMIELVAERQVPFVVMHMRGSPQTMQQQCTYTDVVAEVTDYLARRCTELRGKGISQLIVDPGLGFAKTAEQNLELLGGLDRLKPIEAPIMIGASRKSFIHGILGESVNTLLDGSLAVAAFAALHGCQILRVHDVGPTVRLCRVLDSLKPYTDISP